MDEVIQLQVEFLGILGREVLGPLKVRYPYLTARAR